MIIDFGQIFADTLSGILINAPWFILIWIGFRLIAREIRIGVKNIPEWMNQYFKLQRQQLAIERALQRK
jgi:hypothetical protein